MTQPIDTKAIKANHQMGSLRTTDGDPVCDECGLPMPCPTRRLCDAYDAVKGLLREANDLLRSAHQIAVREQDAPNTTGWANFQKRVDAALLDQHAVMYPKAVE